MKIKLIITVAYFILLNSYVEANPSYNQRLTNDEKVALYFGNDLDIKRLIKSGSNIAKIYDDSVFSKSFKNYSINNCNSGTFKWNYSCVILIQRRLSSEQNYSAAYEILNDFKNTELYKYSPKLYSEEVDNRLSTLQAASKQKLLQLETLSVDKFRKHLYVNGKRLDFIIDLAAEFSSTSEYLESNKNVFVSSFAGTKRESFISLIKLKKDVSLLFFTNSTHNLLGQNFLKLFSKVKFSNSIGRTFPATIYQDKSNIFVYGDFEVLGEVYSNYRFCLDSGSSKTVVMSKGYRKIRHLLKDLPPITLRLEEFGGDIHVLGKTIPKGIVNIGGKKVHINIQPDHLITLKSIT